MRVRNLPQNVRVARKPQENPVLDSSVADLKSSWRGKAEKLKSWKASEGVAGNAKAWESVAGNAITCNFAKCIFVETG